MSKSSDYWKKRETEAARNTIRDEQEYNRRLNEIYEYTIANIERQVNDWYARYASKEGITMAEARGRVKHIDMERYERLAAKYVATHDFSEQANQEMALYNLTMKVNRLELLKAQINLELMAGFDDIQHEMERDLIQTAMKEDRRLAGILGDSVIGNEEYATRSSSSTLPSATLPSQSASGDGICRICGCISRRNSGTALCRASGQSNLQGASGSITAARSATPSGS